MVRNSGVWDSKMLVLGRRPKSLDDALMTMYLLIVTTVCRPGVHATILAVDVCLPGITIYHCRRGAHTYWISSLIPVKMIDGVIVGWTELGIMLICSRTAVNN